MPVATHMTAATGVWIAAGVAIGATLSTALLWFRQRRTERLLKEREASLRTHAAIGEAIRNHSELAVIVADSEGVIREFNGQAETLLGYSANEVIGLKTVRDLYEPAELEREKASLTPAADAV